MASTPYSLSVTDGTELQLSLTGPQGPAGPTGAAGPNTVTTATTTNITGLLKGNGSTVLAATSGTDYAAASHTHPLSDLQQSGATTGQVPTWSGSAWTPATPASDAAKTWSENNPNIPIGEDDLPIYIVIGGTGDPLFDGFVLTRGTGLINGYPWWVGANDDVEQQRLYWDDGEWFLIVVIGGLELSATNETNDQDPSLLTGWDDIIGFDAFTLSGLDVLGDYLGQLLQASDGSWWRWNGTSWDADVPDMADATGTLAIANGGTGATSASAALVNLGVTGTGVQSALAAATNATGGLVTFGGNIGAATGTSLTLKHPTNTRTATHSWSGTTAYTIQVGAGALITLYHQDAGAQNIIFTPFSTGRVQCANGFTTTGTIDTGNLIASGTVEAASYTRGGVAQQDVSTGASPVFAGGVINGSLVVTSASYPVTDTIRHTAATGDYRAAARLRRTNSSGTSLAGIGIATYFEIPNSANAQKFAGMFGGSLSTVTSGSEIGELVFSPAWNGSDPSSRRDFVLRATSTTTADATLAGNLTASGTVTANTLSVTDTSTTLTNLGGGAAGRAIFGAAAHTGVGSTRKLMGLDTTDSPTYGGAHISNTLGNAHLRITNSSGTAPLSTWLVSAGISGVQHSRFAIMQDDTSKVYLQLAGPAESFAGHFGIGKSPEAAARFDVQGIIRGTGLISLGNLTASGYLEGAEMTAPAVPAANGYRIFAEDNGSGKTRLMVQFATGAAQQIAIEP